MIMRKTSYIMSLITLFLINNSYGAAPESQAAQDQKRAVEWQEISSYSLLGRGTHPLSPQVRNLVNTKTGKQMRVFSESHDWSIPFGPEVVPYHSPVSSLPLGPFLKAVYAGASLEQLQKLEKEGADIHEITKKGENALHIAAGRGHLPTVEALLDHFHFTIDAQTISGQTALMKAALEKHAGVVGLLLRNGADPDIKDGIDESFRINMLNNNYSSAVQAAWYNYRVAHVMAVELVLGIQQMLPVQTSTTTFSIAAQTTEILPKVLRDIVHSYQE